MKQNMRFIYNMKRIGLVLLAGIMIFSACGKNDKPNKQPSPDGSVIGSWHLVSWTGSAVVQDVYLSFDEDGSFDLYQRVETPYYGHFDGSYTLKGANMEGTYSDGEAWKGNPYKISFSDKGKTMSMTRSSNTADVSVYVQASIPQDILSGSLGSKAAFQVSTFRFL